MGQRKLYDIEKNGLFVIWVTECIYIFLLKRIHIYIDIGMKYVVEINVQHQ